MLFAILYKDKPYSGDIRATTRPAHLEYVKSFGDKVKVAGPTLTDDGETRNGGVLILDVANRKEAEAFANNDPYTKAGLFEMIYIRRWQKVYAHPFGDEA